MPTCLCGVIIFSWLKTKVALIEYEGSQLQIAHLASDETFPDIGCARLQQFPFEAVAKIERDVCIVKMQQDEVKKGGQKVTLCYIGYTKQTKKKKQPSATDELPRVLLL